MNEDLKKKLQKFKGTISQQEVDYVQNMLPKMQNNFTGAISNKELEFLKKNLPNIKRR
tara:strand:+ start:302 stop:475 length:174 start_codon:yes stop_codon:yes gene_type:complete